MPASWSCGQGFSGLQTSCLSRLSHREEWTGQLSASFLSGTHLISEALSLESHLLKASPFYTTVLVTWTQHTVFGGPQSNHSIKMGRCGETL